MSRRGVSRHPSHLSYMQLNSNSAPLEQYFRDHDGFLYNPSNPAWEEFHRLARYLHWNKEERTERREDFKDVLARTFNYMYGIDENSLESWTSLCHVLQITPSPQDLHACREAVKAVYVNLVDLVDHSNAGDPVQFFTTEAELSKYTRETRKFFPKDSAHAGGLLKHLLRRINTPRHGIAYRVRSTRPKRHRR